MLEASNNINSIKAKFFSIFGKSPVEPEIKIPIDHQKFEIEDLKSQATNNNPKIESISYTIKSIENEIVLKKEKITIVKT